MSEEAKPGKKVTNADKLKALQKEIDSDGKGDDETYTHRHYDNDHATDETGDRLMREAEKKLKKPAIFADKNRYEQCIELYEQAAKSYRMNENWSEAAGAFIKAAELCENKLKNEVEGSSYYARAARCYVNIDMDEALKTYSLAVSIHMNAGKIDSAAKLWRDIAIIMTEEGRLAEALEAYQKSATCHEASDTLTSAIQCYIAMADLYIRNEDYAEAAELYRKTAELSIEKGINIGSHHEFYFKAILCEFILSARQNFDTDVPRKSYKAAVKVNRRFEGTREFDLLKNLMKAFDEEDIKTFTKHVFNYNKQKALDDFEAQALLRIKQIMKEGPRDIDGEVELDLQ